MINFKNTLNNVFLITIFFVFLFLKNSNGFADQKSELEKLSTHCLIKENKIMCVNFNINNKFKVHLLNNPYRVFLEFEKKIIFKDKENTKNKFIKSLSSYSKNRSSSRFVLELKEPAIITEIIFDNIRNNDFGNLQIQFSETTVTKFSIAKHVLKKNKGNILLFGEKIKVSSDKKSYKRKLIEVHSGKPEILKKNNLKKKYIVFIDPGHGGRDPGAISSLGTLEKNITLKSSIMLKKALKKFKHINPILSRDKDIYLSLKERTNLAKINNADIFISIHADSSRNINAKGISVFSLSDKASDKEARILAKRENQVDNFLSNKNKIKDPIIFDTLIKMFQREAMNDSSFLAKKILSNLEKTKLAVNRGHRFAGFSVLKSYNIPSVLVEIGFLSNKQEEKKLLSTKYLNELSNGLAAAINNYFSSHK